MSQELVGCIKENQFRQKCWDILANFAEEFREFREESKLEEYLEGLGLPRELISKVVKVVDMRKRLFCELAVFVNPRIVVVGSGYAYFGSGDYGHKTVTFGNNVRLETIEVIEYDNGFVRGYRRIARVVSVARPTVIYHTAWDYVGEQKRFFSNELYVFP